jgi:hypothetical protein
METDDHPRFRRLKRGYGILSHKKAARFRAAWFYGCLVCGQKLYLALNETVVPARGRIEALP